MKCKMKAVAFLIFCCVDSFSQSQSVDPILKTDTVVNFPMAEHEVHKIKEKAELFLNACIRHDWKKASFLLSPTSPEILIDKATADANLVGRLRRYEIWEIHGEDYPSALVYGCAELGGRGHGTFRFLLTLVTDKQERNVYAFEIIHEGVGREPTKCFFRK